MMPTFPRSQNFTLKGSPPYLAGLKANSKEEEEEEEVIGLHMECVNCPREINKEPQGQRPNTHLRLIPSYAEPFNALPQSSNILMFVCL